MRDRPTKRVFILGGGASLGAHQVGALKLLEEEGVRPDAIVGSSIGVVNACLYASGGVAHMERAWTSFPSMARLFRPSLRHNPITGLSLFSLDRLAGEIERFLDFEKICASPLELSFILLNLSQGEGQFVSNRHVRSPRDFAALARAGYSIPVLFPPVKHAGQYYVDGGFAWNVPILQAVEMGATEIYVLAVVSTSLPFKRSFRGFPDFLSRLSDVMWRTLANVGYVTTRIEPDGTYRGIPVTVIHPTEQHAGFQVTSLLTTSPARSRRLITAGYRDAKRELARRRRIGEAGAARRAAAQTAAAEAVRGPGRTPIAELGAEPAFRHEVA